ncbi:MAG: hypothetical protein ACREBI_07855 [Nitrosotalea sp.]
MSKTTQLVGIVIMIVGVIMAVFGSMLIMNSSECYCPPVPDGSPHPYSIPVIPVIDYVLLYLGISVSIFGIIIFVTSYFRKNE